MFTWFEYLTGTGQFPPIESNISLLITFICCMIQLVYLFLRGETYFRLNRLKIGHSASNKQQIIQFKEQLMFISQLTIQW